LALRRATFIFLAERMHLDRSGASGNASSSGEHAQLAFQDHGDYPMVDGIAFLTASKAGEADGVRLNAAENQTSEIPEHLLASEAGGAAAQLRHFHDRCKASVPRVEL